LLLYRHAITTVAVQSSAVPTVAGPRFISGTFDTRVSTLQSCPQYSYPFASYYSVLAISRLIEAQHMPKLQNLTHLQHKKDTLNTPKANLLLTIFQATTTM